MLTVAEAQVKILAEVTPCHGVENIPLLSATGRVLASDQCALVDVPPCDNSAMDGYAFNLDDVSDGKLPLAQRICAGDVPISLQRGTCARIFTGAPVPFGADTVVMQENTTIDNGFVQFTTVPKRHDNIRRQGQDISRDSVILQRGRHLRAVDIGLLASIGVQHIPVVRTLRIALLSTGEELVDPGTPLQPGQIYNSNRFLLGALLRQAGYVVIDGGRVGDDLQLTQQKLDELASNADVIVTTGGVSAGEEDYVKTAVENLGQINVWKIAVKPGKPLVFGYIRNTALFGLPGNPVSAFVTYWLFVKPFLLRMQGVADACPFWIPARSVFDWKKAGSREEYLRVFVSNEKNDLVARLYPNQSSGVLSSVSWANALARIHPGQTFGAGDVIEVLLLD